MQQCKPLRMWRPVRQIDQLRAPVCKFNVDIILDDGDGDTCLFVAGDSGRRVGSCGGAGHQPRNQE